MLLKSLRVLLAFVFVCPLALFFLDFAGVLPTHLHWFGEIQVIPLIASGAAGGLVVWAFLTLLFGRIYCSTVCPLGIAQDVVSRVARRLQRKKKYKYATPRRKWSYGILLLVMAGAVFHYPLLVSLLDPYSIFGRIATSLFRPLVLLGNNLLAKTIPSAGSYALYQVPIVASLISILFSLAMLATIGYLSYRSGRRYCTLICPVGTLLGVFSRWALFRVHLDENCSGCTLCEAGCKSECIDSKHQTVDMSRCVSCFNCLRACRRGSLRYGVSPRLLGLLRARPAATTCGEASQCEQTDAGRRLALMSFIAAFIPAFPFKALSVILLSASSTSKTPKDASLTPPQTAPLPTGTSRVSYKKTLPIVPPGGKGLDYFGRRCTACHLCVSKCPAGIITPSVNDLGLGGLLQPVLKYDHGFCNYDCTICTEVCPTSALMRIATKEEKHLLQVGQVKFLQENCVVHTQGSSCGACGEHCPTGAIRMVPYGAPEKSLTIPQITVEACVGCGACEHICPVRPFRAIYVDGIPEHLPAKLGYDPREKQREVKVDGFGF